MSEAAETLAAVIAAKPGGENRPGQEAMCAAVDAAFASGEHLLVEAPTGVGKSLAYLAPAVTHARSAPDARVVVVTATKALQEQLTRDDLPTLAAALPGRPLRFAMLKGRSNYLCRAKLDVTMVDGIEARLDFGDEGVTGALDAVKRLGEWAEATETGDRADAPGAMSDAVVVAGRRSTPASVPGRPHCHAGDDCFAEAARDRAEAAEIVVVNTHLYAAHLGVGRQRPAAPHRRRLRRGPHAGGHLRRAFGVRLTPSGCGGPAARARAAGRRRRPDPPPRPGGRCAGHGARSPAGSDPGRPGRRATPTGPSRSASWRRAGHGVDTGPGAAGHPAEVGARAGVGGCEAAATSPGPRRLRPPGSLDGLADDIALLLDPPPNSVAWIESNKGRPELHQATVDVGPALASRLYPEVTVVATSATLATGGRFDLLARRLGLTLPPPASTTTTPAATRTPPAAPACDVEPTPPVHRALTVPSPFDHARQGWLYVAKHLPEPNDARFAEAMADELHELITAAGGRTLALFTSRAAMDRTADALADPGRLRGAGAGPAPRPGAAGPLPGRARLGPVRHPGLLAGRRPRRATSADSWPSTGSPSPARPTRWWPPAGPRPPPGGRTTSPRSTCRPPPPCWPRAPAG